MSILWRQVRENPAPNGVDVLVFLAEDRLQQRGRIVVAHRSADVDIWNESRFGTGMDGPQIWPAWWAELPAGQLTPTIGFPPIR